MTGASTQVVLFSPFFSGVVLDAEQAAATGGDTQAGEWLASLTAAGWSGPTDAFRLQGYSEILERPVRSFIPQLVAERQLVVETGDPASALGAPTLLRVAFSEYGIGLLVAGYDGPIEPAEIPDQRTFRGVMQELYGEQVRLAIEGFRGLAAAAGRIDPNELVLDDRRQSDLLWIHELLIVESTEGAGGLACAVGGRGATCDFGSGRSVLVCPQPSPEDVQTLIRGIALQTVYWAAAARLDLLLVRRLALLSPGASATRLHDIERGERELLVLFHHVHFFRTATSGLGGYVDRDDWAVWSALADRWDLRGKLDDLDAKLDTLKQLESALHADAAARRERTMSSIFFIFTVITGVAVIFSLVDFLEERGGFSDPRTWRLVVAVAVAALALTVLGAGAVLLRGLRADQGSTPKTSR